MSSVLLCVFKVNESFFKIIEYLLKFFAGLCGDILATVWTFVRQLGDRRSTIRALFALRSAYSSICLLLKFLNLRIKIEVYLITVKPHAFCFFQNNCTLFGR